MTNRERITEYFKLHPGARNFEVHRALGIRSHNIVAKVRRSLGLAKLPPMKKLDPVDPIVPTESSWKETKDTVECATPVHLNIGSLEAALAHWKIDLNVWEVDHYVVNTWDVTMRTGSQTVSSKDGDEKKSETTHTPSTLTNSQVKVWLKRKIPKEMEDALARMCEDMKQYAPLYPVIHRPALPKGEKFLFEIALVDPHIGLMAWKPESGENYDIKIAVDLINNAVDDLLARIKGMPVEKIVLPLGQDFFHVNDNTMQTPKGHNPLEVDGRIAKVFESGYKCLRSVIDRCLEIAPVVLPLIPGNHDPQTSYYVSKVLEAHYSALGRKDVEIDTRPIPRKHIVYGPTLLCWAHGQDERRRDLPMVMASELRREFGMCRHFEIHLAHYHVQSETRLQTCRTQDGGVVIRVLPSLVAADAWTYAHGYMHDRACEAYLWSDKVGYVGHFCTHLRQSPGIE